MKEGLVYKEMGRRLSVELSTENRMKDASPFALVSVGALLDESATGCHLYIGHIHPHRCSDLSPYCTTQRLYDGFLFPDITIVLKK